jgi:outer membrane protein assembly factor BamB
MISFRVFTPVLLSAALASAADAPQWGAAWSRNMVSPERGLPDAFDPATAKNIKWIAKLGNETHSTPVVAGGRVYIGTNNSDPRDPAHRGDRGVLMCFDEATGRLLWQLVVPKREEDRFHDWPNAGISSPATVEGDRVYIVSNRGEVMCLDAKGMADGNDGPFRDEGAHMVQKPMAEGGDADGNANGKSVLADVEIPKPGPLDADILWLFDLTKGAGIWSHDAAHSSILIHGEHLYLNSGTGVDNTHKQIRTPDAPSLVVFNKHSGEYLARDDERIAPNIFHCTWSSPAMGNVGGKPVLFFCGGNGVVYGFEPLPTNAVARGKSGPSAASPITGIEKLRKIFEYDFDPAAPKTNVHRYNSNRRESPSNIFGLPVFAGGKLFVAGGGDIFWGKNESWLKCIDATKTGNVSATATIWSYRLGNHVMSTPAVHDGMVFIADCERKMHCVDAATGSLLWTDEIAGQVWASPYVADGKVYLGTRSGDFYVWAARKEKRRVSHISLKIPISATVTAANGVLYVATMQNLYAIAAPSTL